MNFQKHILHIILVCTAFLLVFSPLLFAQENLTLKQAIDMSLKNNYGIKIAKTENSIYFNNATYGNAGMLPNVEIGALYDKHIGSFDVQAYTGDSIDETNAVSNSTNVWVSLNWTIFDGLAMFTEYNRLEKLIEVGELNVKIMIDNTIADVIISYSNIVTQNAKLNALKEKILVSEYRTNIAKKAYNIGKESEVYYLKALVDLKADSSALLYQNAIYYNTMITLNEILGRDVEKIFSTEDSISLTEIPELEYLKEKTFENNNKLALERRMKEVKELEIDNVNAEYFPIVNLEAGYLYSEFDAEAAFIHYNRFLGPRLAITLKYNVFDGLNTNRKKQNAEIVLQTNELSEKALKLELESIIEQTYRQYISLLEIIDYEELNISIAKKNLSISQDGFKSGAVSSLDFREAQQNLLESKLRRIEAIYHAKLYETQLLLLSATL